mmetsp:Transcript_54428/g.80793  ORF Transcript_54428/g.80793 Transcript_54428/m.80793 type:complete len:176 (-) Transcript_54428:484-1011(-)|eukprot:CAMPEP_0195507298 /NCGR_PEP_ID=MMETSP0794_2-20130614/776_1 /TAXON_ID=515487 /ORGANISM="Stephanopyxis turris, Strain CCMP 815" /LENGTH=175 /DNA_ID=CAMNT_0040633931 /DNA_START=89 /DNA_END=616 /DNA_ORIENTATION=+
MNNIEYEPQFTTNQHDRDEVTKLQARIAESNSVLSISSEKQFDQEDISTRHDWMNVPLVSIADGAHKYVLVSATTPSPRVGHSECSTELFVRSKRGAAYHRNAAEPLLETLEHYKFRDIIVLGGGRIFLDENNKKISIFGYSYGFGRADHSVTKSVIDNDEGFKGYDVTWSDNGY